MKDGLFVNSEGVATEGHPYNDFKSYLDWFGWALADFRH